jgi:phosphoglycerol transferase MdoB-like AlkP superfamily enzyme
MSALFVRKGAQLVLVNLVVLAAYRVLFVTTFADSALLRSAPLVVLRGLRLDVALLGRELLPLAVIAGATLHVWYRPFLLWVWAVTYVNVLIAVLNYGFFRERNQHLWEMLLANLGRPEEVVVALEPFIALHPLAIAATLVASVAIVAAALRDTRPLAGERLPLWRRPRALVATAALGAFMFLAGVEPIPDKTVPGYVGYKTLASKHYMRFSNYVLNQAVINPLYDFFRYYRPAAAALPRYELRPADALHAASNLLGVAAPDPRYPMMRSMRGAAGLGLKNVVIIQVEGLGGSILEHRADDGWVMPYLHELAERGLYFPNLYQSFNATDGSLFATVTSLHRTFTTAGDASYFFPYEVNGAYASLPRVLGPGYRHYFFAGFRQRIADFVTFMNNQGFESVGFEELMRRLGPRAQRASNALGVFDGPMLEQAADILAATQGSFTIHVMTGTSHSPWQLPEGTSPSVGDVRLATFRYVDDCIRVFVARLRATRRDFDQTLFVIVGDHTSVTFTDGLTERLRVSLVLYAAPLERARDRWADRQDARGSHVDVVPTVLGLLDGEHAYGGMGRDLLDDVVVSSGIISSSHYDSLYLKDGFALRSWGT